MSGISEKFNSSKEQNNSNSNPNNNSSSNAPNYKDTIFLPHTDFQMRASLAVKEPQIAERFDRLDIYGKLRKKKYPKKFMLHDGPPFANGTPHAGTAMNKVLKDIIVRMKQMQGFDSPFVPGWDCHGLPIEWKIDEQLKEAGKKRNDIPIPEFRDMCKKFAEHWIDVQRNGFKRLGVNGDWNNPYLTMNPESEATVIRCMGKFLKDGTLCRGERPVLWSVVEETALADAEVEYRDKKSKSIYVAFAIKSVPSGVPLQNSNYPNLAKALNGAYCLIWTTTPWSLPGNRAISYRNDIIYSLVNIDGRRMLIAKDLVENFEQTTGLKTTPLAEIEGKLLEGVICEHPFCDSGYNFDVVLLHGEHVETDTGTGLVHTAPEHGLEDFYVCKEHGISVPHTVAGNGLYYDNVPLFAGKHVFKVEEDILNELRDVDALIFENTIEHSYPHSWRSKAPLIFRTTPQWFISMDNTGLRDKALREIEKVNWIPQQGYNRIQSFVKNRGDWCVSRQRVWGVPLPIFICKKTGEPLRDPEVIERIASIFEKEGSNAWFSRNPQDFLGDKYSSADFEQNMDTMDVWFESASTHAYVLRKNDPSVVADMYLEGSDQHRGWFQHSLLNSCEVFGNSPFKTVLTHGFIVDEEGRKMSKSLGNVVTLDEVVEKWGADIFRMWVSSSDFTQDLKLGINILKQLEDVYRKLRNTLRYMLGALQEYDEKTEHVAYSELPDLEKWVLNKLVETENELDEYINKYDINRYFSTLYAFCANDLSAFYFDIRKDCLYCDHKNDPKRKAYRMVLHTLFHHVVRRLAPIVVFTAEEAWMSFYEENSENNDKDSSSVHLQTFIASEKEWINPGIFEKINQLKDVRRSVTTAIEIARKNKELGSSLQASIDLYDPQNILKINDENLWEEVAITSQFKIHKEDIPENAFVASDLQNIGVVVSKAVGEKCERCWKIFTSLEGQLCERCRKVLSQN